MDMERIARLSVDFSTLKQGTHIFRVEKNIIPHDLHIRIPNRKPVLDNGMITPLRVYLPHMFAAVRTRSISFLLSLHWPLLLRQVRGMPAALSRHAVKADWPAAMLLRKASPRMEKGPPWFMDFWPFLSLPSRYCLSRCRFSWIRLNILNPL